MIKLKSPQEIKIITEAGKKLRKVVQELLPQIHPGVTTTQIDNWADRLIKKHEGEASFKRVRNYHWATCLPVNEQVVHTPPTDRKLLDGDLLTLDTGLYYRGFHTDFATSFIVGDKKDKTKTKFLEVGAHTLNKALRVVKSGNYLGRISQIIQQGIESHGYKVVRELTGHGIGRDLHEDPFVLQFLDQPVEKTYKMRPGLVIAVEVIYTQGSGKMSYEKGSDWSVVSADGSLSACFEHTIVITQNGPRIIT